MNIHTHSKQDTCEACRSEATIAATAAERERFAHEVKRWRFDIAQVIGCLHDTELIDRLKAVCDDMHHNI